MNRAPTCVAAQMRASLPEISARCFHIAGIAPAGRAWRAAARLLALALAPALALAELDPGIAYAQEAIRLLGLGVSTLSVDSRAAAATEYADLGKPSQLVELLLRDGDLGVTRHSRRLVYTCRHVPGTGPAAAGGRHLREEAGGAGGHPGHEHHHHHPGRGLKQLPRANQNDPAPASFRRLASGLPLMHRRGSRRRCRCCTPQLAAAASPRPGMLATDHHAGCHVGAATPPATLPPQPPRLDAQDLHGL
jgi:hypothetical protein